MNSNRVMLDCYNAAAKTTPVLLSVDEVWPVIFWIQNVPLPSLRGVWIGNRNCFDDFAYPVDCVIVVRIAANV